MNSPYNSPLCFHHIHVDVRPHVSHYLGRVLDPIHTRTNVYNGTSIYLMNDNHWLFFSCNLVRPTISYRTETVYHHTFASCHSLSLAIHPIFYIILCPHAPCLPIIHRIGFIHCPCQLLQIFLFSHVSFLRLDPRVPLSLNGHTSIAFCMWILLLNINIAGISLTVTNIIDL